MSRQSHIFRRGAVYYFRMRIPSDLKNRISQSELRFSLRTRNFSLAKVAALGLHTRAYALFHLIRGCPSMNDRQIVVMIRTYFDNECGTDFFWRQVADIPDTHREKAKEILAERIKNRDAVEAEIADNLQNGGFSAVEGDIWKTLLSYKRLDLHNPESPVYRKLGHGFLRAKREANRFAADADKGRFKMDIQDPLFDELPMDQLVRLFQRSTGVLPEDDDDFAPASPVAPVIETPKVVASTNSSSQLRLTQVFEKWRRFRAPTERTATDFGTHVKRFCDLIGDFPVDQITKNHIRTFRDEVEKIPARMTQAQREMDTKVLIISLQGRDDIPRLKPQTVKDKALAAIAAILGFACQEGMVDVNVAKGVAVRKADEDEDEQKVLFFAPEQLNKVLKSPVFSEGDRPRGGKSEAGFWVPLIALLSGARLTEICGLELEDIGREKDVDFFFIRPNSTRKLKTKASRRKIPVHSKLIEWGFLDYVEHQRKTNRNRVFDQVNAKGHTISSAWSAWWGRYIRKVVGIEDSRIKFHSFRHTARRELLDKEVNELLIDAIMGHSNGKVSERYGRDADGLTYSMERLKPAIEMLAFEGVDFTSLRPPKYKKSGKSS